MDRRRIYRYLPGQEATATVPTALWGAVALLFAAGLFVTIRSLWLLPYAVRLLIVGLPETRRPEGPFGIFITTVLLLLITFGGACFSLAIKLIKGEPSGRILTIVLAGAGAFWLLLTSEGSATETFALMGCAGVIAILTLVGEVRRFFTAAQAGQSQVPGSIAATRAIVSTMSFGLGMSGLAFLPLAVSNLEPRFVVLGLLLIGIAVAAGSAAKLLPGNEK